MDANINTNCSPIIEFVVRASCKSSQSLLELITSTPLLANQFTYYITDLESGDMPVTAHQIFITPATWVNGVLWFTGSYDLDRLIQKLQHQFPEN